jgi:AcrR family transcriptional regulator
VSSRQEVLQAAREAFADHGFNGATVRDIAKRAGVDPALVLQFFDSKEGVFVAAMELPFESEQVVATILSADRGRLGETMVRTFVGLWDDAEIGPRMLALVRSAATHELAAARLRELVETQILGPVAHAFDAPDAPLRASLIGSQLIGLGFARYVLKLEPLASAPPDTLAAALGPTIERYLIGEI